MSRQIKFRAWDGKQMIPWEKLKELPNEKLWDILSGNTRYKPLEYTGLKDKNGKEIYEGDVIDCGPYNSVITFNNLTGAFACVVTTEYPPLMPSNISDHMYGANLFSEVIGNIYENPELLEEK